jgi:RNA polymerase sigma-70 factor (ECF subfamily)
MGLLTAPTAGASTGNPNAGDALTPAAGPVAVGAREPMDESAFRALYERTAPALRGYLARLSGSRSLADDLLQEAYVRLLRSHFAGTSDEHTRSYLFRIATNLLRDHYRRPRRDAEVLPEMLPAPGTVGELELRQDFRGVFAALPARERAMLWLAYVEGSSHQEIGSALRVKAASVRVMLFRARSRLAALLRASGLAPTGRGEARS